MCIVNYEEIVQDLERALARIILHGVTEIARPMTIGGLTAFFRGAKPRISQHNDLYRQTAYESLFFLNERQVKTIIKRLVEIGLLEIKGQGYHITDKGSSFLENNWSYVRPDFIKNLR